MAMGTRSLSSQRLHIPRHGEGVIPIRNQEEVVHELQPHPVALTRATPPRARGGERPVPTGLGRNASQRAFHWIPCGNEWEFPLAPLTAEGGRGSPGNIAPHLDCELV